MLSLVTVTVVLRRAAGRDRGRINIVVAGDVMCAVGVADELVRFSMDDRLGIVALDQSAQQMQPVAHSVLRNRQFAKVLAYLLVRRTVGKLLDKDLPQCRLGLIEAVRSEVAHASLRRALHASVIVLIAAAITVDSDTTVRLVLRIQLIIRMEYRIRKTVHPLRLSNPAGMSAAGRAFLSHDQSCRSVRGALLEWPIFLHEQPKSTRYF